MTAAEEFSRLLFDKLNEARKQAPDGKLSVEKWHAVVSEQVSALLAAPKKKRVKGERNPEIDALAEAVGLNLAQVAPMRWKRLGAALADIKAALPTVTPEEIRRRANLFRQRHSTWTLTETSLAMHWSEFGGGNRTMMEKMNPYSEPPAIWRDVAARLFPKSKEWGNAMDFALVAWLDIPITLRPEILRALS